MNNEQISAEQVERITGVRARRSAPVTETTISVQSINDVKRLLLELDPKHSKSETSNVGTNMVVQDGNTTQTYHVKTQTTSKSKRDWLLEGLELVKKRSVLPTRPSEENAIMINDRNVQPLAFQNVGQALLWVDKLITKWLGGFRDGIHICWKLPEGVYKYDIYTHKLYQERT